VSNFMCSLSQLLKIRIAASTTYHPQTDGQTERVNQEVEQFLQLFVNQRQDDWDKWLSIAKFTTIIGSTLRCTPPHHARHQTGPSTQCRTVKRILPETLNDFTSRMEKAMEKHVQHLPEQLTIWPDSMMPTAGKHHCTEVGDRVWLMVTT